MEAKLIKFLLLCALAPLAHAQGVSYPGSFPIPPTAPALCVWGNPVGTTAAWQCVPMGTGIGNVPILINFNGSGHSGLVISDTTGPALNFKRAVTGPNDVVEVQVTRHANYTGGDGTGVNAAFSATTTTETGANNFEWAGVFRLNNNNSSADNNQNVALAGKAYQLGTGITFGGNISCISAISRAQSGCTGLEVDTYGVGPDVNGVRLPLHVIYGAGTFDTNPGHVKDGIRIEPSQGAGGIVDRAMVYLDGDYSQGMTFAGRSSAINSNLINDVRTGPNLVYGLNLGAPYTSGFLFARDNKNLIWSTNQFFKTRYDSSDTCIDDFNSSVVILFRCGGGQVGVGNVNPSTGNTASAYYVGTTSNAKAMASEYTLARWGVPVILQSSGTITTTPSISGVTLTTALPNNAACSPTVGCYMHFPANSITGSNADGMYYTQCSSTTVCSVFNNALATNAPVAIASPTSFGTVTNSGSWTQTTGSYVTVMSLIVPANTFGANGSIAFNTRGSRISNTNAVNEQLVYGAANVGIITATSNQWYGMHRTVQNLGVTNSQVMLNATGGSSGSDNTVTNSPPSFSAVDTTISQSINIRAQLVTAATDWIIYYGGDVLVDYAP